MSTNPSLWHRMYGRVMAAARGPYVRVGVLQSKGGGATVQVSASGTSATTPITLAELAAIHEFGAPAANIPERSFIRRTFVVQRPELDKLVARLSKAYLLGKIDLNQALGLLGAWGAAAVKRTITSGQVTPPDAPATVARKGSSVALVDTAQLVNAVTWEVVK